MDILRLARSIKSYIENLFATILEESDQVFVIVDSRTSGDAIAHTLNEIDDVSIVPIYRKDSRIGDKAPLGDNGLEEAGAAALLQLVDGDVSIAVGGSTWGAGVHIPNLAHVVLAFEPLDLLKFMQMAGRAGRSSKVAARAGVAVFPWDQHVKPTPLDNKLIGSNAIRQFCDPNAHCLRSILTGFLYGNVSTCLILGAKFCGYFEKHLSKNGFEHKPTTVVGRWIMPAPGDLLNPSHTFPAVQAPPSSQLPPSTSSIQAVSTPHISQTGPHPAPPPIPADFATMTIAGRQDPRVIAIARAFQAAMKSERVFWKSLCGRIYRRRMLANFWK